MSVRLSGSVGLTIPSYREMNWHEILSGTFEVINAYLNEIYAARGSNSNLSERLSTFLLINDFLPYRSGLNKLQTDITVGNDEFIRRYIYYSALPQNCILSLGNHSISGNTLTLQQVIYNSTYQNAPGIYYISSGSVTWDPTTSGVIYLSGTTINVSPGLPLSLDDAIVNGVPIGFYSGNTYRLGAKNRYYEASSNVNILGDSVIQFPILSGVFGFYFRIKRVQATLYDLNTKTEYDLSNIFTVKKSGAALDDEQLILMVNTSYVSGLGSGIFVSGTTMISGLTGQLKVRIYG